MNSWRSGVPFMVLATLLFVSLDSIGKYLSATYPLAQIVWGRFFFHLVFVLIYLGPRVGRVLRTSSPGLQLIRSALMLFTNAMFFLAVRYMPLVDVTALLLAGPLFITVLSVPLLKESVGPRRWTGVLIGFVGALIVVQPGPGLFQSVALLGLIAALSNALYNLTTRMLSTRDPMFTTLLYTTLIGTLVSSAIVPFYWRMPDVWDWPLLAMLGLLGALGHLALIKALSLSAAATIAPFGYLNLVWASLFGLLLFGEWPAFSTVAGAAVIVASGLYVFHRERVIAKAATRSDEDA
ncbi:MAG: DMT family transporter [Gammaproteobacteria bacterium]|nr:DMT family transporter [Gammaproteobacteria bacterium]